MKKKVSISIEESTIERLEGYIKNSIFRNKSHLVEFAIDKFMKENKIK